MSTSGAERVAEAARGMSALLAGDLSLEDLFASFCELLRSLVDADEIEVVVRDADAWLRLRFDGNVRRESGDNLPYNDPTVATVAFGRRRLEVSPARFSMPLRLGDEIVGAFFL